MKKLGIFVMSLAVAAFALTSCGGGNNPDPVEVADGFYVVGPATNVASIDVEPAELTKALMASGFNEATKEKRDGMYEKYIALEGGKEFSLVLRETNTQSAKGYDETVYGATLEEKVAETDNAEIEVKMQWGQLAENVSMTVPESGLYHIILDLNKKGDLTSTGGAQIAITPVNWGIRGGFIDANWNQTLLATSTTDFDKESMVATWKDVEVKADGKFKFVSQDCWKIQLDMGGQVKAETSIGQANGEMTTIGENLDIPLERGIWTLELTWTLKGGPLGKSFSYKATKTGEPAVDAFVPTDHVVGISGTMNGWGAPSGATLGVYNAEKSNFDATTYAGDYVYEAKGIVFEAGSTFKFRFDDAWLGFNDGIEVSGVTVTEAASDANFAGVEGCYDVEITITWDGAQRKGYKAVFTPGTPSGPTYEYIEDYFYLLNEGTLTDINIYGWAPNKDNNNEIFGGWPGERVNGDATSLTRVFFEKAIKGGEYKFIVNGTGGQTADPEWVVSFDDPTVHHTLKVTAENELIVVE